MHIKYQARRGAIWVGNRHQGGATSIADEITCARIVGAGQQDHVLGGARLTDGRDGRLDGAGPGVDVEIVRLVHEAENDAGRAGILGRQLAPEAGELSVSRSALPDDATVPACIVVDVDDA